MFEPQSFVKNKTTNVIILISKSRSKIDSNIQVLDRYRPLNLKVHKFIMHHIVSNFNSIQSARVNIII